MARLCFLTERLLRGFGVDHVVHRVADGLARLGHDVDVICLRADRSYGEGAYRVRLLDVPVDPPQTLEARVRARAGLVRQRPYDLYLVPMFPFFAVARWLRLPFVYYEHGVVNPVGLPPETVRILDRIRREGQDHQRRARRVAVVSRFLLHEQVNPRMHAVSDVVYNGADSYGPPPPAAAVQAFRERLGLGDAEVVGYFGRVERNTYKGVEEVVAMAGDLRRRRPQARLLLVGRCDEATRRHFADLPGVHVQRNVPAEEMPLCFSAVDVAVTASRWEGFNLPLAEAQFYSRPVVAYDLAAHPEVVAPSGRLVADRTTFVDAIETLLADPADRRARGEAARAFATRFTWANTVRAMAACVEAALQRG